MPGRLLAHDRDRATSWAFAHLLVLLGALASPAQDLASHAPIVLAADRVRAWQDGDSHFVHLVGRAAALQEIEGVRAEEMLIRVTPPPRGRQGSFLVEIRGERAVPATRPRDPAREALSLTMRSTSGVEIRPPFTGGAIVRLDETPDDLAIVDRFLGDFPETPAAAPPAPEQAVDAGVVGLARNPMIPLTSPADYAPEATPLTGTPSPAPLDRSVVEASLDPQLPAAPRPLPTAPPTSGPAPIGAGPAELPIVPPLPEPDGPPPIPGLPDPPVDPETEPLPDPTTEPSPTPVPPELIPELPEGRSTHAPVAADPGDDPPPIPPELIPERVPPAVARRPAAEVPGRATAPDDEFMFPPLPDAPALQEPVDLPPPAVPGSAFPPVPAIDPEAGSALPPAPTRFQRLDEFERDPLPDDPAPVQPGNVVNDPLDIPSDGPPPGFLDEMDGGQIPGIDPLPDDMIDGPVLEMPEKPAADGPSPIAPGYQRNINIVPRDGPLNYRIWTLPQTDDGTLTTLIDGGVHMVVDDPKFGTVDIMADKAVVWTRPGKGGGRAVGGGAGIQSPDQPLEVYLEGNVRVLLDKREAAGLEDQTEYNADRFYADLPMERYLALDAELKSYSKGFIAPLRTMADSIFHYREYQTAPDGSVVLGEDGKPLKSLAHIQADNATVTGSQFATPGYRFDTRAIEMTELPPNSQRTGLLRRLFNPTTDNTGDRLYMLDARQNTYFVGGIPFFFWPRFYTTSEDINPPLQQIGFRTNNLFGQMVLTDWDGFKLLGVKRPKGVDSWNIDADYLSDRGFALGSEYGYSGLDFSQDLFGVDLFPGIDASYFGYSEGWGLRDHGVDNLGAGPAIVTNYPPGAPIRLYGRQSVPPFQDWRGRSLWRHMQSLLPNDADPLEDFRFQVEIAYESDRNFLEQYFNRVFTSGLDQANRFYGIRQWENKALSVWVEGNQQSWYTDSQWLPKLDYYRLGGAPFELDRYIQYFHHSGVDYANVHTASEVNNTDVFNFLPYDPNSLTSGVFRSGRAYTNHELQVPINLQFLRVTPYVQGQLVGWDSQYDTALPAIGNVPGLTDQDYIRGTPGSTVGRAWGAYGGRVDVMASRVFPGFESELLNVHGIHHKVNFYADYRNAVSDQPIRRFGIQDDLDDNTYELVRRYTAMLYYNNGVLPAQYSPILLNLRRNISPITGTVDVQDSIETARVGISQRLQTKRGPIDNRHIIDWMTFDIGTTYFPQAGRDNFGKSWGQANYNYEWFIGDRTSIVSSGWFDFFGINGDQNPAYPRNRDGIQAIMTGVNLTRIPRTSLTIGYSILNTGPINSSALNVNGGYWLSPKWYATAGGVYDFGEGLLLSTFFSVARIGPDFITSAGLNVNPLQNNFGFSFEIVPRFSPNTRIGSGGGSAFRPDIRYLPQQ